MKLAVLNKNSRPLVTIIVPVYNEQEVLTLFHRRLEQATSQLSHVDFEVLYINDGSQDDSWQLMQNLLPQPNLTIRNINLSRNFGKEAAMTAGFDLAHGDAAILLDADLQDPPELIGEMIDCWQEGVDVVNMKRSARHGESAFKKSSAKVYYRLLTWLSDSPVEENVGDFRLLSRDVIEQIRQMPEKNRYMKGLMSWPGFVQKTLMFDRPERAAGETKWNFWQLVKLGLSGITAFSVKPLRLAIWSGVLLSTIAFVYGMVILSKTLIFGDNVAGYPSLMLVQLILGGVQLLAIGVMGEYIGRIFTETKQRPTYIVMEEKTAKIASDLAKVRHHG